jgi:hypothetical protein
MLMQHKLPLLSGLALLLLLVAACSKSTPFGAELLGDQLADYEFTDTLSVRYSVEREDSVLTSDRTFTNAYFLCGELNDPKFGKASSEVFTLVQMADLSPNFRKTNQKFDSIVMYLRYAPAGVYGDTMQQQTLRVSRLDPGQQVHWRKDYYSPRSLKASAEIGSASFVPRPNKNDSLFVTSKAPFIRVRLSDDFGKELFGLDSTTLTADTAFWEKFRGLKITTTTNGASPGAMLAFNLNDESFSRIRLYYHEDTIKKSFDYFFRRANKFSHFEVDHAGSPAGQAIGQTADDLLYLQGMTGLRVKMEFPYADRLDGIAVNKAELVMAADVDNPALPPAFQIATTENLGDTLFVYTSDVLYSISTSSSGGFDRFGGVPREEIVNGTKVKRYHMTLTQRFQKIVDDQSGLLKNRTLYLSIQPQSRSAMRTVLHGPKSATLPAKLNLTYTRIR